MKTMTKFIAVAAAAAALSAASMASAAVVKTEINQATLDLFGTSNFGEIITSTGEFTETFGFTTVGVNSTSSNVTTISLNGLKDIDFLDIDLDGIAFHQTQFDPSEVWELAANAIIGAGAHTITVHGNVVSLSEDRIPAASYAGNLNLAPVAVPEPATWGLMIMGFGGMGAVLRRRRQATAFA
jgi:opacity protein-like surface antigen